MFLGEIKTSTDLQRKLQIVPHTKYTSLQQMESDWNELLKDSDSDNIFLTWEWINSWWKVYGEKYKLYIVTVKDPGGGLLAIAPLKIALRRYFGFRKRSVLEFIGIGEDVTPEYLDFIVRKGHEAVIVPLLLKYLFQHSGCDVFDLRSFAGSSKNILFIMKYFRQNEIRHDLSHDSSCPVALLPNTWNDFMGGKSRNFRKKMNEFSRRCVRDLNIKLRKCVSLSELESCTDKLIELHQNRWRGLSRAFRSKKYIQFHKLISAIFLERDWLRLYFLQEKERIVAGIYCYYYNGVYSYYQSGRDLRYSKYRVGLVLMNRVIEEAIKEGAVIFDFLTGNETYKYRWAKSSRKNYRIKCWNNVKI